MSQNEPLAIVGMACRFPGGASDLLRFWELLQNGVDAICNVPASRWDARKYFNPNPKMPGKAYVNQGGFLREPIDEFDPFFFRMSPREAESLDPQQRILLEVVFEAVENAGMQLPTIEGPRTGVFVGGFCLDANHLQLSPLNREEIDSHTATSSSMAMLANRISYVFNLQGPSITVDTACSSSLVATHLACQSLWNRECDVAIAGGTNVMLLAETPVTMSKGKFLSMDGRCKTFDRRADGYVRGEGSGAVIIKRLDQAIRDNDRVYAQILATGINQDGRTAGITLPNVQAQAALMRQVYAAAGVRPAEIDYVEAHGTGTQAGDIAEATALDQVLSDGRSADRKVVVGSVKTNIGHLEAAAGIAGLIKAALVLQKREIVPNLHFQDPNPDIPFDSNCIRVPIQQEPLSRSDGKLPLAAINSFGYGGTNAHVLLQATALQIPKSASLALRNQPQINDEHQRGERIVCLSANGEAALNELVRKYVNWLKDMGATTAFGDVVHSMNLRRSHLDNRIVVRAESIQDLEARLRSYVKDGFCDGVAEGVVDPGKVVFVCSGMGPQWWAMGRGLLACEPIFADKIGECDALLKEISGWSVLDELNRDEASSRIKETRIAQCANLTIQVALVELWKSLGVVPTAVVGHSIGEVAAAHVSGALTLHDALLVSCHRSRLQSLTAGSGSMLAIGVSEAGAGERIADGNLQQQVSIAAVNGPTSVTLAGDGEALQQIERELQAEGIFARFLEVEVPYHSFKMDPIQRELLEALVSIEPHETTIPLYSTVTGNRIAGSELDNRYWWTNVRQTVYFARAMSSIIADGYRHFVEIAPHPVLDPSIRQCLSQMGKKGYTVQSMNRKSSDERGTLLDSLAVLHSLGISIDLEHWSDSHRTLIDLPSYRWQKDKYWRESNASRQERFGSPGPAWFNNDLQIYNPAWEVELSNSYFPYLDDHVVQSSVVFPGAAYVEAGLELNRKLTQRASCVIENISFLSMLAVAADKVQKIQLHYDDDSRYYSVRSASIDDPGRWTLNARGRIVQQELTNQINRSSLDALKLRCPEVLDPDQQYQRLRLRGLEYGPAFRTIRQWSRTVRQPDCGSVEQREVLAKLELAAGDTNNSSDSLLLHPTLLDGAFQSLVALFDDQGSDSKSFVPIEIGKLLFYSAVGSACWAHSRVLHATDTVIEGDIDLISLSGEVLASLSGVKCKSINNSIKQTAVADCRYQAEWEESTDSEARDAPDLGKHSWLVLTRQADGGRWCELFRRFGVNHQTASWDSSTNFDELLTVSKSTSIIYVWEDQPSALPLHQQLSQALWPLNRLVQAAKNIGATPIHITVITERSHQVLETDVDLQLSSSVLHGLLPLISNEFPDVKTYLVDFDGESSDEVLFSSIMQRTAETVVALRAGKRYFKRLRRINEQPSSRQVHFVSTKETNVELRISKPGTLDSLEFVLKDRRAPGPGEIEIEVYASSLNFKDLLKVYGQLADNVIKDTYFGNSLGMELSGVVTRVGQGVTEFKVGEDVAGPIRGSFCSYATVPTTYVIHRPKPLSFNQTPVYIGYLAAYRGLVHCAQLTEGEKILIHNATGGVGIAAIQIAKWKRAQIYATAGTKEKREYLRSQGIQNVYDSRSLLFVEQILQDTDGYGVDVVINAIAGSALYKSFNLLAAYGRFIEIGKKDIGEDNGLPMRAFNNNLTFTAVDMDRMLCDRVPTVQQILRDISENFESGVFQPVPMAEFKASDAKEAFAYMAQSKHMGKVVLEFRDDHVPINSTKSASDHLKPGGSYVVTGGTSGFGLQVAQWLAKHQAGCIYLVSRSGIKCESDLAIIQSMREFSEVIVRQVDITDRKQVEGLLSGIRESDRPLKGILHGAMVLDDGFFSDMTLQRYDRVLAPKIDGAWNLHQASLADDLDLFVMFSSISSLVGNAGQANYVAANSFLDGFAHYRRSLGLPATTINWGVLSEAGVLARNSDVRNVLEVSGMRGFTNAQALAGLEMVLATRPTQIGLFDVDWSRVGGSFPALAASGMFRELIQQSGRESSSNPKRSELVAILLPLALGERQAEVEARLLDAMSSILKIPTCRMDARMNIADLGIDSLVAVELIVAIERNMGVELTTVDLLGSPTVSQLASVLIEELISDEDDLLANLDELSEAELDRLLKENAELASSDN